MKPSDRITVIQFAKAVGWDRLQSESDISKATTQTVPRRVRRAAWRWAHSKVRSDSTETMYVALAMS